MSKSTENKRIAKNTLILYIRMIFTLCVSLYTCRVVLYGLGITDYGIYNVVGGVVFMLNFISAAMGNSTQRYISYSLGEGNTKKINSVFSCSIFIHLFLSVLVLILAETIGLYIINHYLNIPSDRLYATQFLYQISIVTIILSIIIIPLSATVIANERMEAYAFITMFDAIMKLGVAFSITYISFDKLISYGFLLLLIGVIDFIFYSIYCLSKIDSLQFSYKNLDRTLLKKMSSFAGWSLLGNLAWIGFTQGLNLLLNIFFGLAINAARSIAVQIQGGIRGLVTNFQMAINPQLTMSYANGNIDRMHSLIYVSSKFSFFLLLCIVLPLGIEINYVLKLWLYEIPDYTAIFSLLTFATMLLEPLSNPMSISIQATGNIKQYQIVEGCTLMLIVPISYFVLKLGMSPVSVYIVQLLIMFVVQILRVFLVCTRINMKKMNYFRFVIVKVVSVLVVSSIVPLFISNFLESNFVSFIIVVLVSEVSVVSSIYLLGLTSNERNLIKDRICVLINSLSK